MTTTLPPFSGDRPTCGKCGYHDATVKHTPGAPLTLCRAVAPTGMPERLCRECLRCGFHWDEATATNDDAVPFRGRVPLGQQFRVELVHVGENSPGETHVRVVHEPSGLHHALSCPTAASAKAAELPLLMLQNLLDQVDAWGRQPLRVSCSPAAAVSVPNNLEQP